MYRKVLLGLAALAVAQLAYSHHSFPAAYVVDEEVTLRGVLVAFMFRNPHSFVHLSVTNDAGEAETWAVEWGATGFLLKQGITRETFKAGDEVIITGNPGRIPEDRRMRMRYIERVSDGFKWPEEHQDRDFD